MLLKKAQSGVTCAKSMSPNRDLIPNLITLSTSSRNGLLNQSIWNYLVSTSEVICLIDPSCALKESDLATNNLLFARNNTVLPLSAYKSLSFCTALQNSFLSARWDAA